MDSRSPPAVRGTRSPWRASGAGSGGWSASSSTTRPRRAPCSVFLHGSGRYPSSRPASGRGVESDQVALERGRLDAVIAGLLFMAGMRRSEVSALRWADVDDAADGDGVLVTVRRGKTNQEGETRDVRFVKGGVARALRTLRAAASPAPEDRVVPLSPKMVGLRFQAAAPGRRRRAGDRPLGAGRAGVGAHEPGRVNDRRDARRELEDEPDGGALLGRRDRRTRGRGAVPLSSPGISTAELLEGVCDVTLAALDVELPRGFGRD